MLISDFIDQVEARYSIEDVLYLIGKDQRWLLYRIREELLKHKDDFIQGDDYYTRIEDYD